VWPIATGSSCSTWRATRPSPRFARRSRKLFNVEVESIQVLNVKGKIKRFGATPGRRNNVRRAYVRLKEGNDIDFAGSQP
jgi:large subunit ribosomal protein L23